MECRFEQAFARFLEVNHKNHSTQRKPSKRIHVVKEDSGQRSKQLPDQILYVLKIGRKSVKPLRIEQNRSGQKRNRSSTMLENMRGIYFVDPHNEEHKQILPPKKKREVKTGKTCRAQARFIGQTERRDLWQPPCGCKAGN